MKLEYTLKNDVLFKMTFVKYPDLLKQLIATLLHIRLSGITEFAVTNSEIPPNALGEKFCRIDIKMTVNGQRVSLEVQVKDEGDFPERALYYWARDYSSALNEGGEYSALPRTIIICIVAFEMFDCEDLHSEFQALEVKRHTPLTDKQVLHFFELSKLPDVDDAEDELKLWLALFKAETEEDLAKIDELGVPIMQQAIAAFRYVSATDEFKELEYLRSLARHNEASALGHARREGQREGIAIGAETEREKWQGVVTDLRDAVADKDAALAKQAAQIEELMAQLGDKK